MDAFAQFRDPRQVLGPQLIQRQQQSRLRSI
jgi:hypothetical protein